MRGTPFGFSGWHLGLNTIDSPFTLVEGETRECLNVVSTERGAIKKRTGSTLFNKSAESPNLELISLAYVNISGTPYLLATGGKKIFSINGAGEVTDITDAEAVTEGKQWSIVQFNKAKAKAGGPVYLQNGTDPPRIWTGAEKATKIEVWKSEESASFEFGEGKEEVIATPKGKYMVSHLNRIFVANLASEPSVVRCSTINTSQETDPSIWPKKAFLEFDPNDGTEITGLGTVGPYVIVFKPYKCWIIHAAAPLATRQLSENTGCISHRSITETPVGTFFLTADQGVYVTNGSRLTEMSYKVRPTILAINAANREKAAGAFFNNHYYLSFPSGTSTTPNRTLDYDVALKSWWLHDLTGNQWVEAEMTTGEPFLYTIKPETKGGIAKAFASEVFQDVFKGVAKNYTGDTVKAMTAFWISPWEPFFYFIFRHRIKAPFIKKRVRQLFFDGSGEIIPFQFKSFRTALEQIPAVVNNNPMSKPELPVNFMSSEASWGEGTEKWGVGEALWGGSLSAGRARAYSLGTATEWSFGFGNNSKEPFEITFAAYMAQFRKS